MIGDFKKPFYESEMVNYRSNLKDEPETPIIEYLAEWLSPDPLLCLRKNQNWKLKASYKDTLDERQRDKSNRSSQSNREEQLFCEQLFKNAESMGRLGIAAGREINLVKSKHANIDLVSYEQSTKTIFLIECKAAKDGKGGNEYQTKETLLRAFCEIMTYDDLLDKPTFKKEFVEIHQGHWGLNIGDDESLHVRMAILFPKNAPFFSGVLSNPRLYPKLNKLIKTNGIVCEQFNVSPKGVVTFASSDCSLGAEQR
jgi:hypothetical protein